MSQQKLLARVVGVLESIGIEYMVTGSFASSLQGEPRATHDIDLVVAMATTSATKLIGAFPPPRYYLDYDAIVDAVATKTSFNLLDTVEGDKVDFWILTDEAFDRSRFARASTYVSGGMSFRVSQPEDTILMKLRWALDSGGSSKQFGDALRVYEVQFSRLDMGYMNEWAKQLGVEDELKRIRDEAVPL